MDKLKEFSKTLTFWFVLINIVVYIAILINPDLLCCLWNYNINYNPSIEIWRFVTAIFTHTSLFHLLTNLLGLVCLGNLVEKYLTKVEYFFVFLITGVITEIASFAYHILFSPYVVGCGASGAICGLLGFIIATLIKDRKDRKDRIKFLFMVVVNVAAINLFIPNVDNIAHFAGLFGGLVLGFIFMKCFKHEKMNDFLEENKVEIKVGRMMKEYEL